jgi:hypothetical protein
MRDQDVLAPSVVAEQVDVANGVQEKGKSRLTGVNFSFPFFGAGATWENTSDEREARARSERSAAFTALWALVQDAHIGLRNDFDRVDELSEVHRQVNVLLIQQAPALTRLT